ncbi:hypothetical protein SAMN05444380_1154 [Thermophagus xiamenensis]|uniref:Virus attachment protein p12 family protein n=2 Tax=Thermophagus xiamenensis TaxID=385682 RepID=A0A1I2C5L7_9BACT|nr:hypothetical protein SAMN05444380_1154 [Thermophagus xiamenensis]
MVMSTILIMLVISIVLVGLAVAGLAIKSFFKKDATLTTCSGGSCSCASGVESCELESK